MAPSQIVSFQAKSLIRFTGWATALDNHRWRCPAVLIQGDFPKAQVFHDELLKPGDGLLVSGQGNNPLPGEIRGVVLKYTIPKSGDLKGMFNYRLFLSGRNIQWQAKVLDQVNLLQSGFVFRLYRDFLNPLRQHILEKLKILMPPLEASLSAAVLLGAKDETSREASSPFSDLGLAHLFAVSGLHVGVLLGLFLLPGKLMGISGWKKWFSLLAILPLYALLTGLPGSVVRASGLAILAVASNPLGRVGQPLHFLGLLFWVTTLWNPDQVLDTGVRLSYAAAGGILVFTSLTKKIDYPRHGWRGFFLGGLFISLAAQWFTLPMVAASFGRLSLVSPLANLVAVPSFGIGVWLVVLALMGSFLPWGLGGIFASWSWFVFRSLAGLVKFAGTETGGWNLGLPVPTPGLVLLWIVATGVSLLWLRHLALGMRQAKGTILLLTLTGVFTVWVFHKPPAVSSTNSGPEVWQFDVGQGDCSFIRFPDGWSAIIDTGGRFGFSGQNQDGPLNRNILPWLNRLHITSFDAVILTHGHLDHTGGARFLQENFDVDCWFGAGTALKSLLPPTAGLKTIKPVHGEILHQWENWTLKVIYPLDQMPGSLHENDYSLVTALKLNQETQLLWSGDLEKGGEKLLVAGPGPGGSARVWKAGHHGSDTSGSQIFLDTIKPELILISCGAQNSYQHPSHGYYVVSGDTIPVLRTDLEGSIHLKFAKNGGLWWESQFQRGHLPAVP